MKLPSLPQFDKRLIPSKLIYTSPHYDKPSKQNDADEGQLLPYMAISRGRTEIIQHDNRNYISRHPTAIVIDSREFKKYNSFINGQFSEITDKNSLLNDARFRALTSTLQKGIIEKPTTIGSDDAGMKGNSSVRLFGNGFSAFQPLESRFSSPDLSRRKFSISQTGRRSVQLALPELVSQNTMKDQKN